MEKQLLTYSGRMKTEKVEPTMKWFEIGLERHVTDEIHSYITLSKELRITPGELEESGKILGKDLWVRAHWRDNTVEKDCWKDRWSTGTIEIFEWGDNLESIQTQTNLLRCLEHSGRINWREANEQENTWAEGKNTINTEKHELSPPEKDLPVENNWRKTKEAPHEWN